MMQNSRIIGRNDAPGHWIDDDTHRSFLAADAHAQLDFFKASLQPDGKISNLDINGNPLNDSPQELLTVARIAHSYALAEISGYSGATPIIEAALTALRCDHRDEHHGGYVQTYQNGKKFNTEKLAYGHAFVLLAASTAIISGHQEAQEIFDDVADIIDMHFWDDASGLMREEFHRDWTKLSTYRGMNANMHSIEAMLTAFDATGDDKWLYRAGRIIDFFVDEIAPSNNWRIPEHYNEKWEVDPYYEGNPMFRPAGTTPGHSFEMGRLIIQHWEMSGRKCASRPQKAYKLIDKALSDAWCNNGGFVYTLKHDGSICISNRYWWPATEAIGALVSLIRLNPSQDYELWYRSIWKFSANHFIDFDLGGWLPQIDKDGKPCKGQFIGKPDIYHSLQADLIALSAKTMSSPSAMSGCLSNVQCRRQQIP